MCDVRAMIKRARCSYCAELRKRQTTNLYCSQIVAQTAVILKKNYHYFAHRKFSVHLVRQEVS